MNIEDILIDNNKFLELCKINNNRIKFKWINRAIIIEQGLNMDRCEICSIDEAEGYCIQYNKDMIYFDEEDNIIDLSIFTDEEMRYALKNHIIIAKEESNDIRKIGVKQTYNIDRLGYKEIVKRLFDSNIIESDISKYSIYNNILWVGKEENREEVICEFVYKKYLEDNNIDEYRDYIRISINSLFKVNNNNFKVEVDKLSVEDRIYILEMIGEIQKKITGSTNEYYEYNKEMADKIIRMYNSIIIDKEITHGKVG